MPISTDGAYGLPVMGAARTIGCMMDKFNNAGAKARLDARRRELTDRMSRLDHDARRATEPLSPDFAEQAVQRENDDVIDRLRENTAAELRQIALVLARVADGTYVLCVRCAQRIEPARLEAMPASSHCIACETHRPDA